jgi:hypothetical protein
MPKVSYHWPWVGFQTCLEGIARTNSGVERSQRRLHQTVDVDLGKSIRLHISHRVPCFADYIGRCSTGASSNAIEGTTNSPNTDMQVSGWQMVIWRGTLLLFPELRPTGNHSKHIPYLARESNDHVTVALHPGRGVNACNRTLRDDSP